MECVEDGSRINGQSASLSVASAGTALRSVLLEIYTGFPPEGRTADCGLVEFCYTRAGCNGVTVFLFACSHVVYVTCIG